MSKASILDKIRRHGRSLYADYRNDKAFSAKLGYIRALNHLTNKFAPGGLAYKKQSQMLLHMITEYVKPVIEEFKDDLDAGEYSKEAPIWVCWWDGIDEAPELIKRCVRSIIDNAGKHPVNIIDKHSYQKYLEIPQRIMMLVGQGSMSLTNLADYIRVVLLAEYGGLWIDATVFAARPIPEDYFALPFYSCNGTSAAGYVADGRWATYCIGGWRNHVLFRFLKASFEYYCENNDSFIDYFLIDYLIAIAYDNNLTVKTAIDGVPINNPHRFKLRDAMLLDVPAGDFEKYIYEDTVFYKLSRKALYGMRTPDGAESIYSYFLRS